MEGSESAIAPGSVLERIVAIGQRIDGVPIRKVVRIKIMTGDTMIGTETDGETAMTPHSPTGMVEDGGRSRPHSTRTGRVMGLGPAGPRHEDTANFLRTMLVITDDNLDQPAMNVAHGVIMGQEVRMSATAIVVRTGTGLAITTDANAAESLSVTF